MGNDVSKFLTDLKVKNATDQDDGKWVLLEPLVYQSDVAKMTITVPAGFVTNFASVPRIPVAYWLCGDTASEAAAVHDYLYTSHIVSREVADAVLKEASALTGVAGWRAGLMWAGVRLFGEDAWEPQERDENGVPVNSTKAAVAQPTPYQHH
jgi:hypothetical protein